MLNLDSLFDKINYFGQINIISMSGCIFLLPISISQHDLFWIGWELFWIPVNAFLIWKINSETKKESENRCH